MHRNVRLLVCPCPQPGERIPRFSTDQLEGNLKIVTEADLSGINVQLHSVLADAPSKLFLLFKRNESIALKVLCNLCHFCLMPWVSQAVLLSTGHFCQENRNTPGLRMAARAPGRMKVTSEYVSGSSHRKESFYERDQRYMVR